MSKAVMEFSTPALFAEKRLVILENFDPPTNSEQGIDFSSLPEDESLTVVFRFGKNLTAQSPLLKAALIRGAQLVNLTEADEQSIFPFLDSLAFKNPKALEELDGLLARYGSQYLLTMIFYLLRRMIQPGKNLSPFVAKKIARQRQNFSPEEITNLYKEALEADFKIKNGLIDDKMALALLLSRILAPSGFNERAI